MKCLITYQGNGLIMDNIISVDWESLIGKNEHCENLRNLVKVKSAKGVITATDVNNNTVILGAYHSDVGLDDIVKDIMKWVSYAEDTNIYIMPPYEPSEDDE